MLFNNQSKVQNILGTCYVCGEMTFINDQVLSAVGNRVKRISATSSHVLPFQTPHNIRTLTVSPNSILLVAIDIKGHCIVFNLKGYFIVAEFNFKAAVPHAQFSPDGRLFAIGWEQGFSVYRSPPYVRTFQPFVLVKKYKNKHAGLITAIAFSPDCRFLATCGEDGVVFINNLFPLTDYIPFSFAVHRHKILAVYYAHDMHYIYTLDSGGNLFVWKWVQDELTQQYTNRQAAKRRKLNNSKPLTKIQPQTEEMPSQTGGQLLSEFERNVARGRYILAQKLIFSQAGGYVKRIFYDPSTGFLAAGYSHGKFSIYKLVEEQLTLIRSFTVGKHKISALTVNSSCTWVALGLKQLGQLIVWEWKSQSYIVNQTQLLFEHTCLASAKGRQLASGTEHGAVKLHDITSGQCVFTFQQHHAAVTDVKYSDQTTLFSCSLDGSVHAYDALRFKKFRTYSVTAQLCCLDVDQDVVFAGGFDPFEIYSWNIVTGNLLQVIAGHQAPVTCLALAGQQLLTGGWDKQLKIHQVYARRLNVETLDHAAQISCMAVHPGQKEVAVATSKGQIYIWDTTTAALKGILHSQLRTGRSYSMTIAAYKSLTTMAYSPCGNYLYGGGKSKELIVYDILHRMVVARIELTHNLDLQGVISRLNSRFIKDGTLTYNLQDWLHSEDEDENALPGAKKVDVSQINTKLAVEVRRILVRSPHQVIVCTSFGILQLSSEGVAHTVFHPYELSPNVTPGTIIEQLRRREYASALALTLQLNLGVKRVVGKIGAQHISTTVRELGRDKHALLLEKLCETPLSYRDALWVEAILRLDKQVALPMNINSAIEPLAQQVKLMIRSKSILQMGQILALQ